MASLSISRALIRTLALLVQDVSISPDNVSANISYFLTAAAIAVFREVRVDRGPDKPEHPGAILIPHFHVRRMSPRANIWFSRLPVWIILGLPGFRS